MAGVNVEIGREDPVTDMLTYTHIRLYRATSPGGTFSYISVSAALVATTFTYTLNDASGTVNSYYRFTLYNATGPVESDLSAVIQPAALTMRRLRIESAALIGAGFKSTCTATGTTTTLRDTVLLDSGVDAKFLEAGWIYRPDAALAADMVRRIKKDGFDSTAGDLSPNALRPWTNAPASAEEYHAFMFFPPIDQAGTAYSWDRAIRDALTDMWFVDQIDLGVGDGATREFSLDAHAGYLSRRTIRKVFLRTTQTSTTPVATIHTDFNAATNGWTWKIRENGAGAMTLNLLFAPTTQQAIIVEFNRVEAGPYIDTDTLAVPEDVATRAVAVAVYKWMNSNGAPGKYAAELNAAKGDFASYYAPFKPSNVVKQ